MHPYTHNAHHHDEEDHAEDDDRRVAHSLAISLVNEGLENGEGGDQHGVCGKEQVVHHHLG